MFQKNMLLRFQTGDNTTSCNYSYKTKTRYMQNCNYNNSLTYLLFNLKLKKEQ